MELVKIGKRRHGMYNNPSESRRQTTLQYIVPTSSGVRQLFQVDGFRQYKVKKWVVSHIVMKGGRIHRTMPLRHKYFEDDRSLVRQHINSFPREDGHMSSREFLSSDLNLNHLYRALKELYPNSHITQEYYREVFLKEFPNVYFCRLRTDTCQVCVSLSIQIKADSPDRQTISTKLKTHQKKSQKTQAFE
ncbi:hypothetical protein PR048_015992 [Dryococelus australis]|uniref:Uncharacterized protein n=1 Tax=Dryococelus australis TaxID=614101 RepID=A0ABQ9HIN6_9NEOP|nr:hypothetical protein PR048_015992 [Dryococelus australis]